MTPVLLSMIVCIVIVILLLIRFNPDRAVSVLVLPIIFIIMMIALIYINTYMSAYKQGQIDALSGDVKYEITTDVSSKWELINDND